MIVLEDNFNTIIKDKTYIALGSFDGLHIGHMGLINKTLELSKINKIKSMICTFKNHPLSVVNKEKMPKLLIDNETKLNLLEKLGVDIVNLVNFNYDYMKISPEDFLLNMHRCYNLKGIVVGFNYRFGYKNSGSIELLKDYSSKLNFDLHVIDSVMYKSEVVSSSRIRSLIAEGNVSEANKMLLMPFMIRGVVVKGKQLGRTIGFPTANLSYDDTLLIPRIGVYFTVIKYKNLFYKAITSVGYNPTVNSVENNVSIETHILNFEKNIYGENIELYFIKRMRDEIKFNSLIELAYQLKKDKEFAEKQHLEKFS
ncbi:bifunctional riboflavin kinase/FAD synthetase [Clostridium sp. SYSU_GA19001]|uniref:bifunctional riboflavin kinase/FAD synthetase n=1 Tax=Clostridium caldaquaticum TaxID=2940653 RepID=UPI0020779741|nr:bifunctional riboflavin kinase/FAD synthetase [Clostridium caldaquaticum]MCM8710631.1 bifunctional riboflavin kinase/FAD synthetase [Clostridium caldaquaticum]